MIQEYKQQRHSREKDVSQKERLIGSFLQKMWILLMYNRSVLMLAIAINKRKKERPRGAKKRGRGRADDFSKYP